ncbi:MAG: hypothetical protein EPO00_12560 [Chloroflexota bacterium]|nr:MAG: hypothetical protein EPO00_12560 [Chloroflexota bacterium]
MFHMTTMADERIRELRTTAEELRSARNERSGPGGLQAMRLWAGSALLAAGEALVSGARPATAGRAAR